MTNTVDALRALDMPVPGSPVARRACRAAAMVAGGILGRIEAAPFDE